MYIIKFICSQGDVLQAINVNVINVILIEGGYDVCSWLTDGNSGQHLVLQGIPCRYGCSHQAFTV